MVEFWYATGEDSASTEGVTENEVLGRLEFLSEEGFVKCIKGERGRAKWPLNQKQG